MDKKISLSIFLIMLVVYIYISITQHGKDLVQVRIIKQIECKEKISTGYGYQRATNGSKTINCLYLSDRGYLFIANNELKIGQKHTTKSYFIYSNKSKAFKELISIYDLSPIN